MLNVNLKIYYHININDPLSTSTIPVMYDLKTAQHFLSSSSMSNIFASKAHVSAAVRFVATFLACTYCTLFSGLYFTFLVYFLFSSSKASWYLDLDFQTAFWIIRSYPKHLHALKLIPFWLETKDLGSLFPLRERLHKTNLFFETSHQIP